MKKTALILILILAATLALASCSKNEKDSDLPEGMAYTENEAVGYRFYYPEGWTLDRNDGMVSAHASAEDRSNVSVTAFAPPRDIRTLDEYLEREYKKYFTENFTDMEIVEDFSETELGGNDARRIVFTATVGANKYQFMQTLTLHRDGYIYILTYTSTPDAFSSHSEELESIITEFEFK